MTYQTRQLSIRYLAGTMDSLTDYMDLNYT